MNPREFAVQVVRQLQTAGHQALWAGGCVRDQMLGREPKDYDVATSATPDQVRSVFGKNRTLPIGAAFGVITVLGPSRAASQIEVATFRRDGGYSDGRRPDTVEFTDAREDALRRDFTINGMFFDPLTEQVIDYVGGQADLVAKQIRAIGDPHQRIDEDKLRMLRGVRFATTYGFELEPETMAAISNHASEINVVSGERIGAEMRRMLASPNRAIAAELLRASGLLSEILDDAELLFVSDTHWDETLKSLRSLANENFESGVSILLGSIITNGGTQSIFDRWKLSNGECKSIAWICKHWQTLDQANESPWSKIQPLLINIDAVRALAVAKSRNADSKGVAFCDEKLCMGVKQLNPSPLLSGRDLIGLGISPGPQFKSILDLVRQKQLDGELKSFDEAAEFARQWIASTK